MITKFYVQFVAEWGWNNDRIRTIKAARVSQNKPIKTVPGAVVIKMEVDLPQSLFQPLLVTGIVYDTNPGELVVDTEVQSEEVGGDHALDDSDH